MAAEEGEDPLQELPSGLDQMALRRGGIPGAVRPHALQKRDIGLEQFLCCLWSNVKFGDLGKQAKQVSGCLWQRRMKAASGSAA